MLAGVWPSRDWNDRALTGWRWEKRGQRLCGEYCFSIFHICADMDYFCNYLKLQHFNNGVYPCFRCSANRTTMPFTDLGPSSRWRSTPVDRAQLYLSEKHALFSDMGVGLNVWHVQYDILHVMDLGILQHIGASMLYLFMFYTGLKGNFDDKAAVVLKGLRRGYESLGTSSGESLPESIHENV